MAGRLGLSTLSSIGPRKALPLPVRLPSLLPVQPYPPRCHFFTSFYSPISQLQLVRNLSQFTMSASASDQSSISSYEKELAAAKKAVSLAASLCQVCFKIRF
jgi:hypothetical protein